MSFIINNGIWIIWYGVMETPDLLIENKVTRHFAILGFFLFTRARDTRATPNLAQQSLGWHQVPEPISRDQKNFNMTVPILYFIHFVLFFILVSRMFTFIFSHDELSSGVGLRIHSPTFENIDGRDMMFPSLHDVLLLMLL